MNRRRILLLVAIVVALAALVAIVPAGSRVIGDPEDLRAFYCGGQTVFAHHDPYLAQPLGACETREIRAAGMSAFPGLVLPAPLPPFALVPFGVLGLLQFATASSLYAILLVGVMAITAIVISKLTAFPIGATFAALILSDGLSTILNGQIFPFALLALCACGLELQRGNDRRAALYAALSAIEPHVALPAIASLALWRPRTRLPLALTLAALAVIAIVAVGIDTNVEYLTRVLPAHARSEATSIGQMSLTSVLYHLGVARDAAIRIGDAQYAVACLAGIAVARALAKRYGAPEFLALVPPAFGVIGGPFIHMTQMAAVIPALLVLAHRTSRRREAIGVALLLMIVPWEEIVENGPVASLVATAVVAGAVAFAFFRPKFAYAGIATVAALAVCGFEIVLRAKFPSPHIDPSAAILAASDPHALAESTWQAFVETTEVNTLQRFFGMYAPTWLGAIAFAILAIQASVARPGAPAGNAEH